MSGKYSILKDQRTGDYEVVRWESTNFEMVVVQANIKTREKAVKAKQIWEEREARREKNSS